MKVKLKQIPEGTAGASDLETSFLAEMRARRERLAKLLQLVEAEIRRSGAPFRVIPQPAYRCHGLAASRRSLAR